MHCVLSVRVHMSSEPQLHKAVEQRDLRGVKQQLDAGVDVNLRNSHHWTALHKVCSVSCGFVEIAKLLLDRKALVNQEYLTSRLPALDGRSRFVQPAKLSIKIG